MGNGMMLILGFIAGFLCAAYGAAKVVEDARHEGYHDGLMDARAMWENQMKENVLFAKDAEEVSGDEGSCAAGD